MKNLYLEKMKTLGLAAILLMGASSVFGQATINWKGTNTNDADDLNNWAELTNMAGNHVRVGHVGTYANPADPKHPVTTAAGNVSIVTLGMTGITTVTTTNPDTQEPIVTVYDGGQFIINKPVGSIFTIAPPSGQSTYLGGTLIVKSGTLAHSTSRNFYLEAITSTLQIEGDGIATFGPVLMGKNNSPEGGKIVIKDNGYFGAVSLARFATNFENSTVTISNNGKYRVNNDARNEFKYRIFTTKQIRGGEGFDAYMYYDNILNQTIAIAKSAETPFIYFTDHLPERAERLKANQLGSELAVLNGSMVQNALGFEWKYGTTPAGPFDNVLAGLTNDTVKASLPTTGTFYVVCEVTKADGGKVVSNAIQYIISTDKISFSPAAPQFLRLGQVGATVTATESTPATSREWKWSTTAGENYQSFETPITGTQFTPSFSELGKYFVICESVIDGETLRSQELEILVQARNAGPLNINWTGAVSDDFGDINNWSPLAYPRQNNVIIPAASIVWPVFKSGVDTIRVGSSIPVGAKLYIRGAATDTLKWRGDSYGLVGELIVESGVFVKDDQLLRMTTNTSTLRVVGTGVAIFNTWSGDFANLSMANNDAGATGGQIYVADNGKIYVRNVIHRLPTSATNPIGKLYMSGNGKFIFKGDRIATVAGYNLNARFVFEEGYEFKSVHDPIEDWTHVSARNTAGFSISQKTTQYIGPDQLSATLTLENTASLTGFEWKYSNSPFGPWESFATKIEGETAQVSFPAVGTYFVACVAGDGTVTNNEARIKVIDFPITITNENNVITLTAVLGAGQSASEWKAKLESETTYSEIGFGVTTVAYSPAVEDFAGDGIYDVIFVGIVKNDEGQDVFIQTKPIKVQVAGGVLSLLTTGVKPVANGALTIYPNPTNGTFFVSGSNNFTVEVTDLKGAVVLKKSMVAGSQAVTLNAKGVYLVKVTEGAQVKVGRVVVK